MAKKTDEERVVEYIRSQTLKWAKKDFSEKSENFSEKALNISKHLEKKLKGLALNDRKELAEVFSYVIGEEIPFETDDKVKLPKLVALVLTDSFDNHTYKLGEVILHTAGGVAIQGDGKLGNWIEPPKKFVRPATEAEIDAIPAKQIKGLMEETDLIIA